MRKRRYPNGGLNEALQTLKATVKVAAVAQDELPTSKVHPAPPLPELPAGMSKLNSLNSVTTLSYSDLEKLKLEISEAQVRTEKQIEQWDEFGKQLKSALDATMLVISLKSDVGSTKRRRTNNLGDDILSDDVSTDESDREEEDAAQSQASNNDGNSTSVGADSNRLESSRSSSASATFKPMNAGSISVGRQVAFKLPKSAVDEWIQCEVTKVIQGGSRIEVTDPEPDDDGNPGKTYICRIKDVMLLPLPEQPVNPLPAGTVVLARYPETTAFYKAKVVSYSAKLRLYFLRFEGEEDIQKEIEVKDTLVLPILKSRR